MLPVQRVLPHYTSYAGNASVNINRTCSCAGRVFEWLSTLPPLPMQLDHPEAAPTVTHELCQDWMNSAQTSLTRLSHEFNNHETTYRSLGLHYHSIPYIFRQPTPTVLNKYTTTEPLNPAVLDSLKLVFQLDKPRNQHRFFSNWISAQKSFDGIQFSIEAASCEYNRSLLQLRYLVERAEDGIEMLGKLLDHMKIQLSAVENNLREVRTKRKLSKGAVADLGNVSGTEGCLFRRWVGTFPEVEQGRVALEDAVTALRTGAAFEKTGDEKRAKWRNPNGLGAMWEKDRSEDMAKSEK